MDPHPLSCVCISAFATPTLLWQHLNIVNRTEPRTILHWCSRESDGTTMSSSPKRSGTANQYERKLARQLALMEAAASGVPPALEVDTISLASSSSSLRSFLEAPRVLSGISTRKRRRRRRNSSQRVQPRATERMWAVCFTIWPYFHHRIHTSKGQYRPNSNRQPEMEHHIGALAFNLPNDKLC